MTWHQTTDVLVLGSGAAGLAGALRAAQLGRDVLIAEKSPVWGGSAAMSAGALWVPANRKMAGIGIDDSVGDAIGYLKVVTEGAIDGDRLRTFVLEANRMVETFEADSSLRFEALAEYPDYNTDVAGAKPGGRVLEPLPFDGAQLGADFATLHPPYPGELVMGKFMMRIPEARRLLQPGLTPMKVIMSGLARYARRRAVRRAAGGRDTHLTMGQALTSRLRRSLLDRNVALWLSSPLSSLVVEDGRVVGAELTRDGEIVRVKARLGVLVATGGFERNQAMREQYQRHPVDAGWSIGHVDNTGDGITAGASAGAALDRELMREAWWAPTIVPPGASTAWVMVIEKSLPHGCFVDRRGERFVNEAANYSDVGRGMYDADARTHAAVPAWWVFDGRFRKKFPAGPIQPAMLQPDRKLPPRLRPGAGWLRRGDTLDELAAQLDLPAAALRATVERFNGHCRAGSDPDFGRGATLNDRHYSDPRVKPNPSLGPIEKPPFYAVPVVPGDLGTKSGLVTDTAGRVLDDAGRPIPGLYAAGNVTSSVMGRAYPGAGATLAPAMTFAFLAAEAMTTDAR